MSADEVAAAVHDDARRAKLREAFLSTRELAHDVRGIEYLLGYLPDKPRGDEIDREAVRRRLIDARERLTTVTRTLRLLWEEQQ